MLVMSLDSLMVNFLAEHLGIWMGYHLVHRGIGLISIDFFFGPFSIIKIYGEDNSTSLGFLKNFFSVVFYLSRLFMDD